MILMQAYADCWNVPVFNKPAILSHKEFTMLRAIAVLVRQMGILR